MKQVFLTLKFFEAIGYLPTIEDVLDFFITKNLAKRYKKDELNLIIADLIKSRKVVLFDELYLGLPGFNFEKQKEIHLNRIQVSKMILKKIKRYERFFAFIDPLGFFGLLGENSEINLLILNGRPSPLHRFVLRLIKVKDPLIIYESNLEFKSTDIRSAFYLLKMPQIYSKSGVYEKFIFKNSWIFEYFGNYPVDKISINYKVVL